jgi:excisionase family DNA binding protein
LSENYYSPKQIADKLSVSEYTIRKWIRDGKIKDSVKLGHKTIRVPYKAYEEFVSKHIYQKKA